MDISEYIAKFKLIGVTFVKNTILIPCPNYKNVTENLF